MAYANRAALEADVAAWLDRADLTANIPGFIANTEAALNRVLRVQRMIAPVTAMTDQPFVQLPTDFLEVERVNINGADLTYTAPYDVDNLRVQLQWQTGRPPTWYAITGNALEILPAPALNTPVALGLYYYQRIPALADPNSTNWLLAAEPDLYLYGALMQSAPFLKNDERIPVWEQMFAGALGQVNQADRRLRRGQAMLRSRPGTRMV